MEEDENVSVVSRCESVSEVSNCNGAARSSPLPTSSSSSLRAITTKALTIGAILQGIANKTIAFMAIASNTITAAIAASQFSGNDLDAIVATDNTDADYLFDSIDKRIYRNLSMNAPMIVKPVTVNNSDSDSVNENVTMASLGNNLLAAAVTSTFNTIKSNDSIAFMAATNMSTITEIDVESTPSPMIDDQNNYWALSALILVLGTAAGNILVCLAITWERRLQNVTNYFLMSLAITDLMVAILVMPLGILSLVKGKERSKSFVFAFFFAFFSSLDRRKKRFFMEDGSELDMK